MILISEDKESTILDGLGLGIIGYVIADEINRRGFII